MAIIIKNLKNKFLELVPIIFIFYLCLSQFGNNFKLYDILSFNLQYVVIYYWILRKPQFIGYGFIFFAGIINDVVVGLPMGISSLTYLVVASFATYVRTVTVRVSLAADWITFIPTILVANLFYIIVIYLFGEILIDYLGLLFNSIFTIALYPLFWFLFEIFINSISKIKNE